MLGEASKANFRKASCLGSPLFCAEDPSAEDFSKELDEDESYQPA
jgi:hypothetical protein